MVITRGFPSLVGSHDATKVGSASGDDCERGSALLENETKGGMPNSHEILIPKWRLRVPLPVVRSFVATLSIINLERLKKSISDCPSAISCEG